MCAGEHVVVHARLLALPSAPGAGREFVEALRAWMSALRRHREMCSVAECCIQTLYAGERYPTFERVARLLVREGIEDVSAADVVNLLRPLSEVRPFLEDAFNVTTVACDEIVAAPAEVLEAGAPEVTTCFGSACVGAVTGLALDGRLCQLYIAGARGGDESGVVRIRAQVSMCERRNGEVVEFEAGVFADLALLAEAESMDSWLDLSTLYRNPAEATEFVYRQRVPRAARGARPLATVTAHPEFVASIEAHNIHRAPSVLAQVFNRAQQAATGQIASVPGADVHGVRTSEAPGASQVERGDGAKLWRCKVTERGAGYRLHYWTIGRAGVELCAITVESEVFHP